MFIMAVNEIAKQFTVADGQGGYGSDAAFNLSRCTKDAQVCEQCRSCCSCVLALYSGKKRNMFIPLQNVITTQNYV